jgi:hypothetical protein
MNETIEVVPDLIDQRQLAQQLVDAARGRGGARRPGWVTGLTKTVLETALEVEMSEHLGYDRHNPAVELVLFWEPGFSGGTNRRTCRSSILLHGSTDSLIWNLQTHVPESNLPYYGTGTPQFIKFLQSAADGDKQSFSQLPGLLSDYLKYILRRLADEGPPIETAAWMAGYARVTCSVGSVLVASPLYVEYASSQSEAK